MNTEKTYSYLDLFRPGRRALSFAILLAILLGAIDVLVVSTALPTILRHLEGVEWYAWAVGSYNLCSFMTIPVFSTLVGKKGAYFSLCLAVLFFVLGSIMSALAPSMLWIVLGRAVQGMGAGGFFAIPFVLISVYYPSELKPRAVGLVSAMWGTAAVGGPLLGATILKIANWPWIFWINLPLSLIVLVLGWTALHNNEKQEDPNLKLNFLGTFLFALATALVFKGVSFAFPLGAILLGLGIVSFFIFLKHQRRHSTPIIPPDAWHINKPLGIAFLGMAIIAMAFGGTETFLPLLLQGVWNQTPLGAGLILTVGSIAWSGFSILSALFASKPRRLTLLGTIWLVLGLLLLLVNLQYHGPVWIVYLGWGIAGLGMGHAVPTYNTLALDIAKDYPHGVAIGALQLALTWGFAAGPAVAGAIASLGFGNRFLPEEIGLKLLSQTSVDALVSGGQLVQILCIAIAVVGFLIATQTPKKRLG